MFKRAFLIVLDSLGVGAAPDAFAYGDEGSGTVDTLIKSGLLNCPTLQKAGLFSLLSLKNPLSGGSLGTRAVLKEKSAGKDTTTGHCEAAGVVSSRPFPTYPNGFPKEVCDLFVKTVGRGFLCNKPYSGTQVINDYGKEHLETGKYIIYTSADSVFQIAAHEDVIPLKTLYEDCEKTRRIMTGEHAVGRVIARPFTGEPGNFTRTSGRHDYALEPRGYTMLDSFCDSSLDVIGVGKISDIFAGRGIKESFRTKSNAEGEEILLKLADRDFNGLCFVNLVDFDMLYGHRNDIKGYANALNAFDKTFEKFLSKMRKDDILLITADHGCDPGFPGTDHTREYVPLLVCGDKIKDNNDLGIIDGFDCISASLCSLFGTKKAGTGKDLSALWLK